VRPVALAAIFDAGGVLTTSVSTCFLEFEQALGLPQDSLLSVLREPGPDGSEPAFYDLERGQLSETEFWRRLPKEIEARLGIDVDMPSDVKEVRRLLWGSLKPNEEMLAAARAISMRYKTALLTNGVQEWTDLRALACPEIFDVVVDSCEVGFRKPEPQIYERACTMLGVAYEDAVFIDDIPDNVQVARSLGMTGILFTTTDDAVRLLEAQFPTAFTLGGGA
jgi:epoxide hydrolase-like predicted phosphatase